MMSLEDILLKSGIPSSKRVKLKSLLELYSMPLSYILNSSDGRFVILSNLNPGILVTEELMIGERLFISNLESLKLLSVSLRPVSSIILMFG